MYAPIIGALARISVMLVTAFEIFRNQLPLTWLARCYDPNRGSKILSSPSRCGVAAGPKPPRLALLL